MTDTGTTDSVAIRWNELIGPFYSIEDFATWKSCDVEEVKELITERKVLAVTTTDGVTFIPSQQFNEDGDTPPYLCEVLEILGSAGVHSWGAALWLCAETERYDPKNKISAINALHNGKHGVVLLAATRDSNVWKH